MPLTIESGITLGSGVSIISSVDTLPSAVTANLVMSLDAGMTSSYPGSGTAWTDTVGGKVFTLAGTIGHQHIVHLMVDT
jgi:hypothetical protein